MTTADAMNPLEILKERVAEACRPLGLELRQFSVVVADEGGTHHVQVLYTIDTEDVGKTVEQAEFDKAFAELEQSFLTQSDEEKEAEAKASLENLLKRHRPNPEE